jgi:pimeloyl-ACP methyl ester carboxylesterase
MLGANAPEVHAQSAPSNVNETLRVTSVAGVTLVGELFLPEGQGPFSAVVFTHGAEPGERTHRGYRSWAERFRSRGVAALIFDKRGVGDSEGQFVEAPDLEIPAADLLAWVELLAARDDIRGNRIGVLGWSQGGWIGPLAASKSDKVSFVVAISGPGVSPLEQNIYDKTNQFEATGAPAEQVQQFNRVVRLVWTYLATGADRAAAQEAWDAVKDQPWFKDYFRGAPMGDRDELLQDPRLLSFAEHNAYEPVPVLERLRVPMLAVFGGADRIVPVEESVAAMREAFARGGNTGLTVWVFPGANHGVAVRNPEGGWSPAQGYHAFVVDWVLHRVSDRAAPKLGGS